MAIHAAASHRFIVSITLSVFLVLQPAFARAPVEQTLQAKIISGRNQPYRVEVLDTSGQPIRSVKVTFSVPPKGPSGTFETGERVFETFTDENGVATAAIFYPNVVGGNFDITVTAQSDNQSAIVLIPQTNIGLKKSSSKKIAFLLAIGGAAAGIAAIAAGGNSSNSNSPQAPAPTRPTVSFGSSSVSGPPN